jgi:hypothetical protein
VALDGFYAALSNKQKVRFNTLPLTATLIRPLADEVIE